MAGLPGLPGGFGFVGEILEHCSLRRYGLWWLFGLLFDIVKNGRKRNVAGEVLANGS